MKIESQLFISLEHFILKIYGGDSKSAHLLRKQMFCQNRFPQLKMYATVNQLSRVASRYLAHKFVNRTLACMDERKLMGS